MPHSASGSVWGTTDIDQFYNTDSAPAYGALNPDGASSSGLSILDNTPSGLNVGAADVATRGRQATFGSASTSELLAEGTAAAAGKAGTGTQMGAPALQYVRQPLRGCMGFFAGLRARTVAVARPSQAFVEAQTEAPAPGQKQEGLLLGAVAFLRALWLLLVALFAAAWARLAACFSPQRVEELKPTQNRLPPGFSPDATAVRFDF